MKKQMTLIPVMMSAVWCIVGASQDLPQSRTDGRPIWATESFLWDRVEKVPELVKPQSPFPAAIRVYSLQMLNISNLGEVEQESTAMSTPLVRESSSDFARHLKFAPFRKDGAARSLRGYVTVDYDQSREVTLGIHLPPVVVLADGGFRVNQGTVLELSGLLSWLDRERAVQRKKILHLIVLPDSPLSVLGVLQDIGMENIHIRFERGD